jgi:hypothetical protein
LEIELAASVGMLKGFQEARCKGRLLFGGALANRLFTEGSAADAVEGASRRKLEAKASASSHARTVGGGGSGLQYAAVACDAVPSSGARLANRCSLAVVIGGLSDEDGSKTAKGGKLTQASYGEAWQRCSVQ